MRLRRRLWATRGWGGGSAHRQPRRARRRARFRSRVARCRIDQMSSTTVVLMGVAGCGKSTVMAALAERLGWATAEGDDFHSPENVAKMRAGIPLSDEDRGPWLSALAGWIGEREAAPGGADGEADEDAIVTCSALKRAYRDMLREGHESVVFVHLEVPVAELEGRAPARQRPYLAAAPPG